MTGALAETTVHLLDLAVTSLAEAGKLQLVHIRDCALPTPRQPFPKSSIAPNSS
jgi:hypothetical protein